MVSHLLTLFVGLMTGWFFLPVPAWAQSLHTFLLAKFPFLNRLSK